MIFKQWQQVLDGSKTQTRRLVRPYEHLMRHIEFEFHVRLTDDGWEYTE